MGAAKTYKQTEAQKRLNQLATSGASRVMAFGGSRSGKTFEIVREIAAIASAIGGRHAIFRKNFNSAKTAILSGTLPEVLQICFGMKKDVDYFINNSDFYITFRKTKGEIWIHGLDDKERVDKILGKEYATEYFNECSEISYHAVETALTRLSQNVPGLAKNIAFFDCNPPTKAHWAYKLFIEKKNPVSNVLLTNPEDYASIKLNPTDNAANLPKGYIDKTLKNLSGKKRERFLLGNWTDENENALWKPSMIDPYRKTRPEVAKIEFDKIAVGVDPAVTNAENSDETGIVVVGRKEIDGEPHFFVLEDATIKASPKVWAEKVVETFRKWNADRIVAEVNNGGDLVATTIRHVDPAAPVRTVRATRGKVLRAEPVAALYERGLVHHVGEFYELETQMTSFTGCDAEKSPDRLDALVWAVTDATVRLGRVGTATLTFG